MPEPLASRPPSLQACKPASLQASKPPSLQASKPPSLGCPRRLGPLVPPAVSVPRGSSWKNHSGAVIFYSHCTTTAQSLCGRTVQSLRCAIFGSLRRQRGRWSQPRLHMIMPSERRPSVLPSSHASCAMFKTSATPRFRYSTHRICFVLQKKNSAQLREGSDTQNIPFPTAVLPICYS